MLSKRELVVTGVLYFCLKLIFLYYFISILECNHPGRKLGNISISSGDTFSYTGAMESFISTGEYFFLNENNEKVRAGRLPHYSIPYFALRQVFGVESSYDFLVIFQIIIEALAVVYFCFFIGKLLSSSLFYYLSLLLFLLSLYTSHFSLFASPESLSLSFLLLFFVAFYEFSLTGRRRNLFISSSFLAFVCVLKPYYLPLYLLFVLEHVYIFGRKVFFFQNIRILAVRSVLIFVPFLIIIFPWIFRNFLVEKEFIPLQQNTYAGYFYTESDLELRKLISGWGENYIFWEKTSAGCFFYLGENNCQFKLSQNLSEVYEKEELLKIGRDVQDLRKNYSTVKDKALAKEIGRLIEIYKAERPFEYYVGSKFDLVVEFLVHKGTYYLPFSLDSPCFSKLQLGVKILQAALYWIVLVLGLIGLFLLSFKSRVGYYLLFIPFYLILLFPLVFGNVEWRYFHHAYPFLSVGVFVLIDYVLHLRKRIKNGQHLLDN